MRLRTRIAVVIVVFAVAGFSGMTAAGWLLVLRAEDEILDALVIESVQGLDWSAPAGIPDWIEPFADEAALRSGTGLDQLPEAEGWHEVFANEARTEAVVVKGMRDRWRIWMSEGLEHEYRLQVRRGTPPWVMVDLARFEFTEAQADGIFRLILALAVGVAAIALVLSALIARWTVRPVIGLAERVRAPRGVALSAALPNDEIGFLARSLDEAQAREAAAIQRERLFIAECSHELRTPLATLKSALTVLPDTDGDTEARERVLARMARAMARTERLVHFFLVLAREGREPADVGWVPLGQVVREVVEEQRALCAGEPPVTEILIEETTGVRANRDVIAVLLRNLVSNAFQHAASGCLRVSWLEDGRLRLDDNGPGFPDLRPRATGEKSTSPGFGVGLVLSERLCRTQRWRLERGVADAGGARVDIVFSGIGEQGSA